MMLELRHPCQSSWQHYGGSADRCDGREGREREGKREREGVICRVKGERERGGRERKRKNLK